MSLVVETGAGLSDAESYISVADASTYVTAFGGNALWTVADTAAKETALRIAAQYLDSKYRFRGQKNSFEQALAWPRYNAIDDDEFVLSNDELPIKLKQAQVEAALRHLAGDNLLGVIDKPGAIASESVTVGPIQKSVSYVAGRVPYKAYPKIQALLKSIIETGEEIKRS